MSCLIDSAFTDSCRGSVGGVSTVYLGNFPSGSVQDSDWLTQDVDGVVTAFISGSGLLYEYQPNKTSSQFTETYEASLENGSFGFNQLVSLTFANMTQAKQNQVKLMSQGNLYVVVKDKNSTLWLIGSEDGAVLSGGSADSGKALADGNKYTLEITANQGTPAYQVDADAVSAILAP